MALPIGIEKILQKQNIESDRIEFKEGWDPDSILRSICAFANDIDNNGGGYILLGVSAPQGVAVRPVKGIPEDSIDRIEKELLNDCHFIEPYYAPRFELADVDGKKIIVLWVLPGHSRPYRVQKRVTQKKDPLKFYWIRRFSSTVEANDKEIKELFEVASDVPFDDRPCPWAVPEDLSKELMQEYLSMTKSNLAGIAQGMTIRDLAQAMGLLDGPSEDRHPTNVALLMFSYKVNDFFPEAYINIVTIPQASGEDILEKDFKGPIQYQLRDALYYLKNNLIEQRIVKLPDQAEAKHVFNYPYEALEELLPNAVYHRSYEIREPVTVLIAQNYVDIKSFPGFDSTITDENIRSLTIQSRRPYRNRSIGNYLKDYQLTEGHNTGIPRALRFLNENGSPAPLFLNDKERSSLIVRLFTEASFLKKSAAVTARRKRRTTEEIKNDVIALLSTGDYSVLQIASKLGYASPSLTLRKIVDELVASHIIQREGSRRSASCHLISKK
jgi:ATP-dependent DNA helicase RecG